MRARIFALALAGVTLTSASYGESINLQLGYLGQPIRTDKAFRSVDVGDPTVVDVRVLNDRAVVFRTKKVGSTNVVFYNEAGEVVNSVNVFVNNGSHAVEVLHPVQRRGIVADFYRCGVGVCEYVSNDANAHFLEETRTEPAQNNLGPGGPAPNVPSAPRSP